MLVAVTEESLQCHDNTTNSTNQKTCYHGKTTSDISVTITETKTITEKIFITKTK